MKTETVYIQGSESIDELVKRKCVAFLNTVRDYERESLELICFDERTSEEFYEMVKAEVPSQAG